MGYNPLLSLFIWMLIMSQLWPVGVLSVWLVSFWHVPVILWVLPEFLFERSCIFQALEEVSCSPGVSGFLSWSAVFGNRDTGALKRVPFPACLGPDSLRWPPWPPTLHYVGSCLALPVGFSPHCGGKDWGRGNANLFFTLGFSRL